MKLNDELNFLGSPMSEEEEEQSMTESSLTSEEPLQLLVNLIEESIHVHCGEKREIPLLKQNFNLIPIILLTMA